MRVSQLTVLTSLCRRDTECHRIQSKALRIKGRKYSIQCAQGAPSRFPLPKELYTSDSVRCITEMFAPKKTCSGIPRTHSAAVYKKITQIKRLQWLYEASAFSGVITATEMSSRKSQTISVWPCYILTQMITRSQAFKAKLTLDSTDQITNQEPQ